MITAKAKEAYSILEKAFGGNPDDHIQQVYKTAKGSLYFADRENRTLRLKSYHPEHGMEDQGWKNLSSLTLYISDNDCFYIAPWLHINRWLVIMDNDGVYDLHFTRQEEGKWVSETIQCQTTPEEGLCPVEFFGLEKVNGALYPHNIHPGNKITEITSF